MIHKSIDKGIVKFSVKPMVVVIDPFPELSSSIVTPNLSKLTKPRPKVNVGQTSNMTIENKYGQAPAKTIHDLKRSHEGKQKEELVPKADLSTKTDLWRKTTYELLNEIWEQQIKLIKRGLCPKCKAITRLEGSSSSKRP